ncbi:MAG: hypothetical protein MGAcid_07420 [uncultured Acidilobus sp. MG]|jgi:hypothetical protein|nr:MAG: hypothetical protein MGAcid_07420 [uncultured Acidilobus sp. MG]
MVLKVKVRHVKAREIKGRKEVGSKVYEYEYFTLPLNLYVKKHVIERWGSEFTIEVDEDTGVICVKPKSIGDLLGLAKCPSVPLRG